MGGPISEGSPGRAPPAVVRPFKFGDNDVGSEDQRGNTGKHDSKATAEIATGYRKTNQNRELVQYQWQYWSIMLNSISRLALSVLLASNLISGVLAQTPSDLMLKGEAAYRKKEYAKSAEFYLEAYKKDSKQTLAAYNAACSLALDGQAAQAISVLDQLADKGFNRIDMINGDTDLASLRSDARWSAIVTKVEANAKKNPPRPRWVAPYTLLDAPADAESLRAKLEGKDFAIVREGDVLTFIKKSAAKKVDLSGGIQEPMKQVGDSDIWVLPIKMSGWDKAIVSYAFIEDGKFPVGVQQSVWRGPSAPAAPARANPLQGKVVERTMKSRALNEDRKLFVYLPPNAPKSGLPAVFLADGSAAKSFGEVLEPLILSGKVRPCAIVGVENGGYRGDRETGYDPEKDFRALEYVPGQNPDRFAKHLKFFTDEVGAYVAKEFGISTKRADKAVTGFSNGGAFSAAVATRRPDFFGTSMPLSLGIPANDPKPSTPMPRMMFAAGSLESFSRSTKEVYELVKGWGVNPSYEEYVAGHDFAMWELAFTRMMPNVFPPR